MVLVSSCPKKLSAWLSRVYIFQHISFYSRIDGVEILNENGKMKQARARLSSAADVFVCNLCWFLYLSSIHVCICLIFVFVFVCKEESFAIYILYLFSIHKCICLRGEMFQIDNFVEDGC